MNRLLNLNTHKSEEPIRLAIWGTSGAGKTTYLTRLYEVLINKEWGVETDKKAQEFIDKNLRKINKGEFPDRTSTQDNDSLELYCYKLIEPDSKQKTQIELNFIDAPGEFYERIKDKKVTVCDKQNHLEIELIDYLLSCHGIVFLLDPLRTQEDGDSYYILLGELFREMQSRQSIYCPGKQKLEQYVAFAITKIDRKNVWEKYKYHEAIYAFIDLLGPSANLQWLKNFFQLDRTKLSKQINKKEFQSASRYHRCQFFTISSIGMYKDSERNWHSGVSTPKNQENNPSTSQTGSVDESPSKLDKKMEIFLHGGTKINAQSAVSNASTSQNPEELPLGGFITPPNSPFWELEDYSNVEKIIIDKKLQPIAVDKPIEWLIKGIKNSPPSPPKIPTNSSPNSVSEE
ncbi:MAG: hypothetical protein WA919_12210 [Coleofasciculaceae cyanobacterium]